MANIEHKTVIQRYEQMSLFRGGVKEIFFPNVHRRYERVIDLSSYISKRGATPFTRGGIAPNYDRNPITSKTVNTIEISEQVAIDNKSTQTVLAGTNPYALSDRLSPQDLDGILYATAELRDRARRKHEVVCCAIMTTGKVEVLGSEIDLERDAKYNITGDWSDLSAGGVEDTLEQFYDLCKQSNLPQDRLVLLLGTNAATAFMRNESIRTILDNRRLDQVDHNPGMMFGSLYRIGTFIFPALPMPVSLLTYTETYQSDSESSEEVPIFPTNSAVFTSLASPRHMFYGGVSYPERTSDRGAKLVTYMGDEALFDTYASNTQLAVYNRVISHFFPLPSNVDHLIHATITT